ncbi:MAG: lipopolysaccharide heptosyltransferase II [Gammaproteobacteria bacterium]|nr:lipopolysaccharide heptosyltransferase II [Gammaproteobacteria bacterium]MBU1414600.1 lipopolysaccharide heptosyltransferase II [Gammaproteobacteria bacterium]
MPRRILIVAPSWIGDTIMMQPLLMRLKACEPDAEIHVIAPAWSAPLLARMPEVAATIENPFAHGKFDWAGRKALGRRLTTADFSAAFVLPNSWKSALVPFFAKIPTRTGYTGEARYFLLNDRHTLAEAAMPRLVDRYAALAGPLDTPTPNPRLTSTPGQQRAARAALGLPFDVTPVVFCPGAEYGPAKRWPAAHFAALAQKVSRGGTPLNGPIWCIGSTKDAEVGAEIERLSEGAARNLCGRTNLEQAIDLIADARAVVSNDSGLMHVAAALDRPLAALYGSSSPAYTPPLSPRAKIVSLDLECSPCFKRECPLGHLNCLNQLQPEQVLAALAHDDA